MTTHKENAERIFIDCHNIKLGWLCSECSKEAKGCKDTLIIDLDRINKIIDCGEWHQSDQIFSFKKDCQTAIKLFEENGI